MRTRISSIIKSVAILLILSDWFLNFNYIFGIRVFYIGVFLLISRRLILNLIFGPKKSMIIESETYQTDNSTDRICQGCGTSNPFDSDYCIQCGSVLKTNTSIGFVTK